MNADGGCIVVMCKLPVVADRLAQAATQGRSSNGALVEDTQARSKMICSNRSFHGLISQARYNAFAAAGNKPRTGRWCHSPVASPLRPNRALHH
eukprot:4267212-Amphidinium_carterae.1